MNFPLNPDMHSHKLPVIIYNTVTNCVFEVFLRYLVKKLLGVSLTEIGEIVVIFYCREWNI